MVMVGIHDLDKYNAIVGYGIGKNYEWIKCCLTGKIIFDYLADQKWEHSDIKEYDGIPVIHLWELNRLEKYWWCFLRKNILPQQPE